MGILKKIVFGLLGLIVLALIVAAFLPTHFESEASKDIDAPKATVFGIINDLKTWNEWGPWMDEDPDMKITYGEKTKGVGAHYSWIGKDGNGSMTVTEVDAPNLQKSDLIFEGMGKSDVFMKTADGGNGSTKLTWGMAWDMPWPINLMSLTFSDADMNEMYEKGLNNIKAMAEKKAAEAPKAKYTVNTEQFPGRTYLGIKERVNAEEMGQEFFGERFGQLMGAVGAGKLEMAGPASGLYFTWDDETKMTDMAVAVPVKGAAQKSGNIEVIEVPASKAYVIDYYGPYEGTGAAHYAMEDYMKANGLSAGSPVIEEYVTDPSTEPDQSKWLTKIYYLADAEIAEEH